MDDNDWTWKAAVAALIVLGVVLLYRAQHPSTTFAADGIDSSWDAAARRSQAAGKPSIVLFTADWCPYCRKLESDVLSQSEVQWELQRHYSFYTVDLTNPSQEVRIHASKLGVSGIPLLIRYDADGKETARTNGLDTQSMVAWLKAGE